MQRKEVCLAHSFGCSKSTQHAAGSGQGPLAVSPLDEWHHHGRTRVCKRDGAQGKQEAGGPI